MPRTKTAITNNLGEEIKKLREVLQLIAFTQQNVPGNNTTRHAEKRKKKGRPKGDLKMNFCLSMPQKLYLQLKNYLETYGEKGENMASIIIAGTEKELKERITKKLAQINLLKEFKNEHQE